MIKVIKTMILIIFALLLSLLSCDSSETIESRNVESTMDCMEHDICSYVNYATDSAWNSSCGDEYMDANLDVLAFWCRG